MYGLIHTALKQMIVEQKGDACWHRVAEAAGVGQEAMLTMRPYDDAVTMSLVDAAARTLDVGADEALRQFGRYWITRFAPGSYDMLLQHTGSDTFSFLTNLNNLHDRIATTFAEFKPPHFSAEWVGEGKMLVHYLSARQGLTPFVVGLLEGLQHRFDEPHDITIESVESGPHGEHARFILRRAG